jgi:predicted TIM-barrel fold metal-dependent hydrolase
MIKLNEFTPEACLELSQTECSRSRFPVIDAHSHLTRPNDPKELVKLMDLFNIRLIVDLDGWWNNGFDEQMKLFQNRYPDRFRLFCRVDISEIDSPDFSRSVRRYLHNCYNKGASGIKFSKSLGLHLKDKKGNYIKPDDDRLKPIWETAAELEIPITIHIADPIAFFHPIDANNERYEELADHPNWSYYHTESPRFAELLDSQKSLLRENPSTTFIVAHVGSYPENLKAVGYMMDEFPNMFVDTAERISELGRQPYSARDFLIRYQDRVLYGTDLLPNAINTSANYRFFETHDEYFPYNSFKEHNQGRWRIYGVNLPDDVLKKIYYQNAERLLKL